VLIQLIGDRHTNKGIGVSANRSFSLTILKMAIGGIFIPDAYMQHDKVEVTPLPPELCLQTYFLPAWQTVLPDLMA
jgi:hypothetical protein